MTDDEYDKLINDLGPAGLREECRRQRQRANALFTFITALRISCTKDGLLKTVADVERRIKQFMSVQSIPNQR